MTERNKVMKITTELVIADRKIHNSRMTEAFEKGVAALAAAASEVLLDGSISEVKASVDWAYVQGHRTLVITMTEEVKEMVENNADVFAPAFVPSAEDTQ